MADKDTNTAFMAFVLVFIAMIGFYVLCVFGQFVRRRLCSNLENWMSQKTSDIANTLVSRI